MEDFDYQQYTNLDQHAYLEILATRLEAERFKAATDLDLAAAEKADTSAVTTKVESLTMRILRLRARLAELPALTDEQTTDLARLKQQIRFRPERPERPERR
jgi:uncharacterized membrane protein